MKIKNQTKDDGTIIQVEENSTDSLNTNLLGYSNYVGYAEDIGNIKCGKKTGEDAITIFVSKKLPTKQLADSEILPKKINGIQTDVLEIGEVFAGGGPPIATDAQGLEDYKKKYRPIPMGVSHGNITITAGTTGGIVLIDGIKTIATNTHVACENIRDDLSDQELKCCQQGAYDGGHTINDYYGRTLKAIVMPEGQPAFNDFAVVMPDTPSDVLPETLTHHVTPTGTTKIAVNDKVWKEGRTTGYTIGEILSLNATINVNYGGDGVVLHKYCILSTDMSAGGDSGSWVYKMNTPGDSITDEDKDVTLYLFAGSSTHTVHHDIHNAVSAVGGTIYTEEPVDPPTPPVNEIEVNVELTPEGEAETFRVFGSVVTTTDKSPIHGCIVTVAGVNGNDTVTKTTMTDVKGKYNAVDCPVGYEYEVYYEATGYDVLIVALGDI